jgi:hypothetical protein
VKVRTFWVRHRTLFWSLHSLWALATGVGVMWLAQERYGFVPWVALFLILTWVSTLLFGRRIGQPGDGQSTEGTEPTDAVVPSEARPTGAALPASEVATVVLDAAPSVRQEAASYVTRALYQETLFFLLPFYAYSTVMGTLNMAFLGLLGVLALFSCLDLVFDRILRTRPVFALVFFTTVAFAALNLVIPMLAPVDPNVAITIAAVASVVSAAPLSVRSETSRVGKGLSLAVGVGMLTVALFVPSLVPPVPLRLEASTFSRELDRETLEPIGPLTPASELRQPVVFVLLGIFAPGSVPTSVSVEWRHDRRVVRRSRDIEITAHEGGFRVWDAWRNEGGDIPPGHLEVDVRTQHGRIFGRAEIELRQPRAAH